MKNEHIHNIITQMPLFENVSLSLIAEMLKNGRIDTYKRKSNIITKDSEGDYFYIIINGNVNATVFDVEKLDIGIGEDVRELIVNSIGAGGFFGEISLVDFGPRTADITTTCQTKIFQIRIDQFRRIFFSDPVFLNNLLKIIVKKLRVATDQIEDIALKNVYSRILILFEQNKVKEKEKWVLKSDNQKWTRDFISKKIGATRGRVTAIIEQLKDGNYITMSNGQITIEKELPSSLK